MKFETIKIANFMSFEEVEYNFSDKGLVLVSGKNLDNSDKERSNGSGKSTLLEALFWCLFGQTTKKIKSDDVVNRTVGANTSVELDIEHGDAEYKIIRYRSHTKHKNDLFFYVNSVDKSGKNNVETQEIINKTLQIDYKLFLNSVFFPQESKFNFISSTDKEQKEILTDILDLKYIDSAQESIKLIIKDLDKNINDKTIELNFNKNSIDDYLNEKEQYKKKVKNWASEYKNRIDSVKSQIENLKNQKDSIEILDLSEIDVEQNKIEDKLSKISDFEQKKTDFLVKKQEVKNLISNLKEKISDFETKNKKIDSVGSGECSKCFQIVNTDHLKVLKVENDLKIEKLNSQLVEPKEKLNLINEKLEKIDEILSKKSSLEQKYKQNEQKKIKNQQNQDKIESLLNQIQEKEQKVVEIKQETNPYLETKDNFSSKIKELEKKCGIIEKELKDIDEKKRYYEFWKDGFSNKGVKSFIFDGIVEELNSKIEYYLDELFDGQFKVVLNTESKNSKKEVQQKLTTEIWYNKEQVSFESLSGGEKRSVVLSADLALSDIVAQYNHKKIDLLVLDEVTDFLDDTGKERFLNLLQKIDKNSIFMISHDKTFQQKFNNTVEIIKENGISRIE